MSQLDLLQIFICDTGHKFAYIYEKKLIFENTLRKTLPGDSEQCVHDQP